MASWYKDYEYLAEVNIGMDTPEDHWEVMWGINPKGCSAPTHLDVLEGIAKSICRAKCLVFYKDIDKEDCALIVCSHIQSVIVKCIYKNTDHKQNTEPLCPHGYDWDECPECCH